MYIYLCYYFSFVIISQIWAIKHDLKVVVNNEIYYNCINHYSPVFKNSVKPFLIRITTISWIDKK